MDPLMDAMLGIGPVLPDVSPERDPAWQKGDAPCEANDYACQICGAPWGH